MREKWSVFSCVRTEYRKIQTKNNSAFVDFLRSEIDLSFVLPEACFVGTKFSHVIFSAHPPILTHVYKGKLKKCEQIFAGWNLSSHLILGWNLSRLDKLEILSRQTRTM